MNLRRYIIRGDIIERRLEWRYASKHATQQQQIAITAVYLTPIANSNTTQLIWSDTAIEFIRFLAYATSCDD